MKLFLKPIISLIFIALAVRLLIAFWSFGFRENTDVLRYRDWGRIAYLHGLSETYKQDYLTFGTLPNNQPPGSLLIVSGMYRFWIESSRVILKITKAPEGSLQWVNGPLLNFYLRLPSIVADLAIGAIIYLLVRKKSSEKDSLIASSLFLFNPVIFYNSSFWGQMDSINNLFLLFTFFAIYIKKIELIFPLYILSLLIKMSSLPFFPLIILLSYVGAKKDIKRVVTSLFFGIIILFIFTLPVSNTSWLWIMSFVVSNGIGEIQNITAFAFNFWWVVFKPAILIGSPDSLYSFSEIRLFNSPQGTEKYFGSNLFNLTLIIFLFFITPVLLSILRLKQKILKIENLALLFATTSLLIFLFLPRMHERYLYPLFPFLAIYIGSKRKLLPVFILLSILSMINLYVVWHPFKIPILTFEVISNIEFQWITAFITVTVGIIFYLKSLRALRENEK